MKLNEPQKLSYEEVKRLSSTAHFIDIIISHQGETLTFEGDWLKQAVQELVVEDD